MPAEQPRLGKVGFIVWLVLPFVILTALYLSIDRSQGKANPRLAAVQSAQLPGQDAATGRPTEEIAREVAETKARQERQAQTTVAASAADGASRVKPDAKPSAAPADSSASTPSDGSTNTLTKSVSGIVTTDVKPSAGTIQRLSLSDPAGKIESPREVLVWLPPGYDAKENAELRYSVLYMQDGQELFSPRAGVAAPGEWQVDETVARLMSEKKIEPLIVVGIVCAAETRTSEYLTMPLIEGHPPLGMEYVEFLAKVVKPAVDKRFRTSHDPAQTAVGGASIGSMVAFEAVIKHPEAFGMVMMESPPLVERNKAFFNRLSRERSWPLRISVGVGAKEIPNIPVTAAENRKRLEGGRALSEMLRGYGLREDRLRVDLDADGGRDVPTWSRRFASSVQWLFAKKSAGQTNMPAASESKPEVTIGQ